MLQTISARTPKRARMLRLQYPIIKSSLLIVCALHSLFAQVATVPRGTQLGSQDTGTLRAASIRAGSTAHFIVSRSMTA
jgi:hypothetical protein